jgi:RNA polymerase sigma-70 factor (ECF subfamily)
MERYARGEDRAFAELHAGLAPRLSRFLRRLTGRDDLAEDLTQEALLRMHRARGSFRPGGAAVPWALAIARNCHIDHLRAARARVKVAAPTALDRDSTPPAELGDTSETAEQWHIAQQTASIVERELARMTVARREAFLLLRFEGLSVAEAAAVLGTTESAVKLRAFHAYEALRNALRAAEAEDSGARR